MSIRILGGVLKGLSLNVPKGDLIRPTSVMLKRRFFDSKQSFDGAHFIDLCAGSGAMGIEAASRGADKVTLVEFSPKVFSILSENVKAAKGRDSGLVINAFKGDSVSSFREMLAGVKEQDDVVIFFDPPYQKHDLYWKFLETAIELKDVSSVEVWVESDSKKGITQAQLSEKGFDQLKTFSQGDSFLTKIF